MTCTRCAAAVLTHRKQSAMPQTEVLCRPQTADSYCCPLLALCSGHSSFGRSTRSGIYGNPLANLL